MVVLLVVASCLPLSVSEFQRNRFILFLLAGHLGILAPSFRLCHHALPLLYSSHVTALMHFLLFSITIIGHFWVRNWSETLMTADITQIIPILAWQKGSTGIYCIWWLLLFNQNQILSVGAILQPDQCIQSIFCPWSSWFYLVFKNTDLEAKACLKVQILLFQMIIL